jgi:DNA-binding HxlR family transcriptional regulator
VSGDHIELTRLGGELTAVLTELEAAEEQWLELTDEAERASN